MTGRSARSEQGTAVGGSSHANLAALIGRAGLRATPRRLLVLEELAKEPGAVTAQTLWSRLRSPHSPVGLTTVYRTLALLHERGVIDTLPQQGGEVRYRLCGDAHHHHLVCTSCGKVIEIDLGGLGHRLGKVAASHGFLATGHQIEIVGLCPGCLRRES